MGSDDGKTPEELEKEKQEELEDQDGLEERVKEKQLEPDPIWKQKGFESLEAYVAHAEGMLESERAARRVAEQALTVKPAVQPPQFDRAKYDDDPEGYSAVFNKEVQDYLASSGAPTYPSSVLDEAVKGVLSTGEKSGINRHVLYGTMRSLVAEDPSKKGMLETPDGIRELGRQALDQFKEDEKVKEKEKEEAPAEHDQPKGSPSGSPKKTPSKESEVEKLGKEIEEAAKVGKMDDVVDLTFKRSAAKLRKERGDK